MKNLHQSMTLMGRVLKSDPDKNLFTLKCRSGDEFDVKIDVTTNFSVVSNLDGLNRDRVPELPEKLLDEERRRPANLIRKYIHSNALICVQGVYQENDAVKRFGARTVSLLHWEFTLPDTEGKPKPVERYLFEDTHWWITQIARMADEWLEDLFDETRSYTVDDFAQRYRTNLSILGSATDDNIQECATLSRLIYGLSSAYLITGAERYYLAAKAGVEYLRLAFRSTSHDGKYSFWAYGRRKLVNGSTLIIPSQNGDDADSIPLYEQIYALAGLAQYYRISLDWQVLEDIRRTVDSFNAYFLDDKAARQKGFPGEGGYFSHLDYSTMRPDSPSLGKNQSRKNWNSVGDHIPAYLVNVLLSLDPLPQSCERPAFERLLTACRRMLDECTDLIIEKFPDKNEKIPYVNERFDAHWNPDHSWGWQQNRAVVGHNQKIAWNLTRCANYYAQRAEDEEEAGDEAAAKAHLEKRRRCLDLAIKLAKSMAEVGVDQLRGGLFDAVEREPRNGQPIEFAWGSTKDFWQQEQSILAYLILHGLTGNLDFLALAREGEAFWNLFFLDRDNRGVFFRTSEDGTPIITGMHGQKAGHAVAGYHSFELNYLADLYIRTYVEKAPGQDANFCIYFKPDRTCGQRSINIMPDFFPPGKLMVVSVRINGKLKNTYNSRENIRQIDLDEDELGTDVVVEFCPIEAAEDVKKQRALEAGHEPPLTF